MPTRGRTKRDAGRVTAAGRRGPRKLLPPLLLVAATALAYAGSFGAPFIYDDYNAIVENPHVRSLLPLREAVTAPDQSTVAGRPLVAFSLAVNYAISALRPWSYHLGNLLIHLAAGLALYGVTRRTLGLPRVAGRPGLPADRWAMAVAALWLLHPLQTEAVTYVSTRTESLMGALALVSLYALIRSAGSPRPGRWEIACVVACAAAMASKEVAAAVPVLLLCYDAVFVSDGVGAALRRRPRLYAGLAGTWLILAALLSGGPRSETIGLHFPGLSPLDYLRTQVGVIWHYVRLAAWPHPLVLDYFDWPVAHSFTPAVVLGGAVLLGLAGGAVVLVLRRSWLGYLGVWFFLLLAPTSSFVPITSEVAAERRMYLPLAAIVVAVLAALWRSLRTLEERRRRTVFTVVAATFAVGLTAATFARNRVYSSEIAIWEDTVTKRPTNSRALVNLATALVKSDRRDEATALYRRALEVDPTSADALEGLGGSLLELGQRAEGVAALRRALELNPSALHALENLGLIQLEDGQPAEAVRLLERCAELQPLDAVTRLNLANAYLALGDRSRTENALREAVRLAPDHALAHARLASMLADTGRGDEADALVARALRLAPGDAAVRVLAGKVALGRGDAEEAVRQLEEAVRLDPAAPETRLTLVAALRHAGRGLEADDALVKLAGQTTDQQLLLQLVELGGRGPDPSVGLDLLRTAVQQRPGDPDLHFALGRMLASVGDAPAALLEYREALRLRPRWGDVGNSLALLLATADDPMVRDPDEALRLAAQLDAAARHTHPQLRATLAIALASAGRRDEARMVLGQAISLARDSGQEQFAGELERYWELMAQLLSAS